MFRFILSANSNRSRIFGALIFLFGCGQTEDFAFSPVGPDAEKEKVRLSHPTRQVAIDSKPRRLNTVDDLRIFELDLEITECSDKNDGFLRRDDESIVNFRARLSRCLQDFIATNNHQARPRPCFHIGGASDDAVVKFSVWVQDHVKDHKFKMSTWPPRSVSECFNMYIGKVPESSFKGLVYGMTEGTLNTNKVYPFNAFSIESDLGDLDAVLGLNSSRSKSLREEFSGMIAERMPASAEKVNLVRAYADLMSRGRLSRSLSPIEDCSPLTARPSCHDACEFTAEAISLSPDLSYSFEIHAQKHVPVRWVLKVVDLAHKSLVLVSFGPAFTPAVVVVTRSKSTRHGISVSHEVYDRNFSEQGKNVSSKLWEENSEHPIFLDMISNLHRFDPERPEPVLTLCEPSLVDLNVHSEERENLDAIVLGPHLVRFTNNTVERGSLFGWYPNERGTLDQYSAGVVSRGGFIGPEFFQYLLYHGKDVMSAALEGRPDLKFLPAGVEPCFFAWRAWSQELPKGTHVASASYAAYFTSDLCEERYLKYFRESRDDVLWVVGAVDTPSCFRSYERFENVISVGGVSDSYQVRVPEDPASTDIYALGDVGSRFGSSYATPRVAAPAAFAAKIFPHFRPSDLKKMVQESVSNQAGVRLFDEPLFKFITTCVAAMKQEDPDPIAALIDGCKKLPSELRDIYTSGLKVR